MRESPGFVAGPTVRTSDGVDIATYDLGGAGPDLLLAHATGFHGRMWLPVASHLRHRYHCIAFDERGQGSSGKDPTGQYHWSGFALDARAVIEGWGPRFDPGAVEAYVEWGFEDLADGTVRLRCRREDEARIYEQGPFNAVFGGLDRVRCPVTLSCGDDGAHFDKAHIDLLAARLPRARTEVMAGTGHFGPYERPAAVAGAALDAFVAMEQMVE